MAEVKGQSNHQCSMVKLVQDGGLDVAEPRILLRPQDPLGLCCGKLELLVHAASQSKHHGCRSRTRLGRHKGPQHPTSKQESMVEDTLDITAARQGIVIRAWDQVMA